MKRMTMVGTAGVVEEVPNTVSTRMRAIVMKIGTIAMTTMIITMIVAYVEVTTSTRMTIEITDHATID